MKSLIKTILAILIVVSSATSLSCKKDLFDEKRSATLNIHPSKQITGESGIFSAEKEISKNDISKVDKDWDKILDIWLKSSQFRMESKNLQSGDLVQLEISCSDVSERYNKTITVEKLNETYSGITLDIDQDSEYKTFMNSVFNEMKSKKSLNLRVQGIVMDKSESPLSNIELDITINNKLEIKVRWFTS